MILLALFACATPPCEGLPAGEARDGCLARRVAAEGAGLSATEMARIASIIGDPALRAKAVHGWMGTRHGVLSEAERAALCATLPEPERPSCERRLTPPR